MDNQIIKAVNPSLLDSQTAQVAQSILDETDADKVKELTNVFNLYAKKRNVIRVLKMTQLMDDVTDKVIERFQKTPDNFSNDDLIKFMQVTENSIDKASKSLDQVEQVPAIQLNQNNQVNINVGPEFDRQSRQRITDKVAEILSKLNSGEYSDEEYQIVDTPIVEDTVDMEDTEGVIDTDECD